MQLAKSTVLVTGAASGLGLATARYLVARGARVVLVDLPGRGLAGCVAELGVRAVAAEADVTDDVELSAALELGAGAFGQIDAAVLCAGVGHIEKTVGRTRPARIGAFARVLAINVTGTFNCVRLLGQRMARREPAPNNSERGVFVMTSSIQAFDGQEGWAAYAAAKGAIAAMTLPLARELGGLGIRVCTIAPGVFDTPMLARLPSDGRALVEAATPCPPRLGHADEFAALAGHILENTFLNGVTIRLDGGLRLARTGPTASDADPPT